MRPILILNPLSGKATKNGNSEGSIGSKWKRQNHIQFHSYFFFQKTKNGKRSGYKKQMWFFNQK